MKRWLIPSICMVLAGCVGAPTPIPAAQTPAARLYADKCGRCHSLPHPKRHTIAQWQHLMDLMEQRMKEQGIAPLSEDERGTIFSYLRDHARR